MSGEIERRLHGLSGLTRILFFNKPAASAFYSSNFQQQLERLWSFSMSSMDWPTVLKIVSAITVAFAGTLFAVIQRQYGEMS